MRLQESVEQGIDVFGLEGEIDFHYAPVLRTLLQGKVKQRTHSLILDLAEVDYIDSSGMAAIIEYFRDTTKQGGILCLAGMKPNLESLFKVVGLSGAIAAFPTVQEAAATLKSGTLQPSALFDKPAA
jgi:anti-anti-sigma factor